MKDSGRSPGSNGLAAPEVTRSNQISESFGAPAAHNADAVALTPEIQHRIGAQLQSLYNDLLTEGTPDRFLKLLDDLDSKA